MSLLFACWTLGCRCWFCKRNVSNDIPVSNGHKAGHGQVLDFFAFDFKIYYNCIRNGFLHDVKNSQFSCWKSANLNLNYPATAAVENSTRWSRSKLEATCIIATNTSEGTSAWAKDHQDRRLQPQRPPVLPWQPFQQRIAQQLTVMLPQSKSLELAKAFDLWINMLSPIPFYCNFFVLFSVCDMSVSLFRVTITYCRTFLYACATISDPDLLRNRFFHEFIVTSE